MQRFFYDCEFIEDGSTIDLVSIGVVGEDGREFYAVSTEFDADKAGAWVRENVLAKLPPRTDLVWMDRATLADRLLGFLAPKAGEAMELWAYYAAYDHVALAQLWGPMIALPGLPMYTHELMQLWEQAGQPEKPTASPDEHDALADARWNRELFEVCGRAKRAITQDLAYERESRQDWAVEAMRQDAEIEQLRHQLATYRRQGLREMTRDAEAAGLGPVADRIVPTR